MMMNRLLPALPPLAALLLALLLSPALSSTLDGAAAAQTSSPFIYDPTSAYRQTSSGSDNPLGNRWAAARDVALIEQAVEDHNAEYVALAGSDVEAVCYRRCIVLPLDGRFDPPVGVFSHGHVDTGDKMSLPRNFWDAIMRSKAEVRGLVMSCGRLCEGSFGTREERLTTP